MAELTDNQRELVEKNWNIVKQDFKSNSVAFFLFFFKTHPEHQEKFASFRGKTEEEIKDGIKLRSHASRVFHAISSMVDNLDDLPLVIDVMQKTVQDHWPRGIRAQEFQDLFRTILSFLSLALKDQFCEESKAGWTRMATILMSVVHEKLQEIEEEFLITKTSFYQECI